MTVSPKPAKPWPAPPTGVRGRVNEDGRLDLPIAVRRAVGLESGGEVSLEVIDGAIHVRSAAELKDRVRRIARESGLAARASVADFLDWRAGERAKEAGSR